MKAIPPASTRELEALISRTGSGDAGAFATLYDQTSAIVFGLVLRIVGDRAEAEEVVQESFLQLWRRAASFDPSRGSPLAWITMTARSRAIDRIRSDASYRGAIAGLGEEGSKQPVGDSAADPEETASLRERHALVKRALAGLSDEQRQALELAFFRGLSHSEIARLTETPLGTIKSRIRAAVKKLEEVLGPVVRAGGNG